jgi:hypothetical protein
VVPPYELGMKIGSPWVSGYVPIPLASGQKLIATVSQRVLHASDIDSGSEVRTNRSHELSSVGFSPSNKLTSDDVVASPNGSTQTF